MEKTRITDELAYYRSYKIAIQRTEAVQDSFEIMEIGNIYETASPCRVAVYSDMPRVPGGGPKIPGLTGGQTFNDLMEYANYERIVRMMDMALSTLTADELDVITLKWMDGIDLKVISDRKQFSYRTIKTIHGRALEKMYRALRFFYLPNVEAPVPLPVA